MGAIKTGSIFQIVDVLTSERDEQTGTVFLQGGDNTSASVDGQEIEAWTPAGWASRPAKPEPGKAAAQALCINRSDRKVAIATRDARQQEIQGALDHGESCAQAESGQARVLFKKDGSISIATTSDNTKTGKTVSLTIAPDKLTFASPWGTISWDETNGLIIRDKSGAYLLLAPVQGLPAPLDVIKSTAVLGADSIALDSAVSLELGGGATKMAVALAPTGPGTPTTPATPAVGSTGVFARV